MCKSSLNRLRGRSSDFSIVCGDGRESGQSSVCDSSANSEQFCGEFDGF
jgi:hypothetical protein